MNLLFLVSAVERTRTSTAVTPLEPESSASANSATTAYLMAEPTGFEPAVSCVTGRHVRPLHHGSAMGNLHLKVVKDERRRDRTADPYPVKVVLSQLSYAFKYRW